MKRPAGVTVEKAKEMWNTLASINFNAPLDSSFDIAFMNKYRKEITNMIAVLKLDNWS